VRPPLGTSRSRRVGVPALGALVVAAVSSCAGGADVPAALQTEAERIAAIDGPSGWERIEPPQLIDGQFVREVDGVPILFAGEVRADGEVRPLSAGTAWRSPALTDPSTLAAACDASALFAFTVGFPDAVTGDDLAECRALPDDPDLRPEFVASFADDAERVGDGTRTYGAGILLDDDGAVSVVVTVAYGLDPAG
jgi:hypothetical protein